MPASDFRAIVLLTELIIENIVIPLALHNLIAFNISLVSPLCDIHNIPTSLVSFGISYVSNSDGLMTSTYLNILNSEAKNRYQKFENDYWGTSIKELIKYANFENNKDLKIATCGINPNIARKYLEKKGLFIHKFVAPEESDYLIMTNRVTFGNEKGKDSIKMINCFDKYKGNDVFKVMRNGLILSVIRKIKT